MIRSTNPTVVYISKQNHCTYVASKEYPNQMQLTSKESKQQMQSRIVTPPQNELRKRKNMNWKQAQKIHNQTITNMLPTNKKNRAKPKIILY